MPSFFEKLKKGMGDDIFEESGLEEKPESKKAKEKPEKKAKITPEKKMKKIKVEIESKKTEPEQPSAVKTIEEEKNWFEAEGELAVDVYQTNGDVVIQTAIAGVKPEDLDISIESDIVLIKGKREKVLEEKDANYIRQECFWGAFSQKIILPEETDPAKAEAIMKDGVLTIRIPKIERKKKRKLTIKE